MDIPPTHHTSVEGIQRSARTLRAVDEDLLPIAKSGVLRQAIVVTKDARVLLHMLDPTPRLRVIVSVFVNSPPLLLVKGAEQIADVHQVELGSVGPLRGNVVDFEDAVGSREWPRWRESINAANAHCSTLASGTLPRC